MVSRDGAEDAAAGNEPAGRAEVEDENDQESVEQGDQGKADVVEITSDAERRAKGEGGKLEDPRSVDRPMDRLPVLSSEHDVDPRFQLASKRLRAA